jgi:hypothetical protein
MKKGREYISVKINSLFHSSGGRELSVITYALNFTAFKGLYI